MRQQISLRIVVVLCLTAGVLMGVAAPVEAQPQTIMIRKTGACTSADNCDIEVMDRGVGVCRAAKAGLCDDSIQWKMAGNLPDGFLVVINWSAVASSQGSEVCLNSVVYLMFGSTAGPPPTVDASLTADPACVGTKKTWMYNVSLYKDGVLWDEDDPGVLIED